MGTWPVIRKHYTVHQMNELRRVYCGQQSHISRMQTRISGHHHGSCEEMLCSLTEFSFAIWVAGNSRILYKHLKMILKIGNLSVKKIFVPGMCDEDCF